MGARSRRSAGNLPAELTSFVGRRHELGEAKRLLATARLVTLTGAGGVGKTRLALRVAADVRRAFPDGVWLVELADVGDPHLVPNTVATAFGLRVTSDQAAGLAEYLEDKQLLLVLDNCEHVADECATLVAKLLAVSAGLRVLATSRHTLHVEGEHLLHVEPLPVPGDEDAGGGPVEAVTLFADRAAAVSPGFELTPDNRATVSRICRRLEGIPLAIELAAVRVRVLAVDQVLERLDDRLGLLTSRPAAVQPRRRTLEAAIDWSFELCTPAEQRLWAQASVFPGGFDLDAAEGVCVPAADGGSALDVVAGLVDKSVLSRQNGTFGRHAWYRMLETVREYGGARLAAGGDEAGVRARQAGYYADLARRYRAEGFGPRQSEWLGRLRREHANLRAVLEHCLSGPGQASQALDIAASLWNFWYGGGLVPEGCGYLRRGLELCGERTLVRARGLYAMAFLAIQTGAPHAQLLAELDELAEELGDERLRAGHAECAGMATFFTGDLSGGAELLERALAGYRTAGDPLLVFDTLILLAAARFFLGDPRGAAAAEEALALTDRHQARWSRGYALWAVAIHRWRAGEPRQATDLLHEAVALRLPDRTLLAFLVEALAWCHSAEGEHDRVARLLGGAGAVWRLSGARVGEMSPYQAVDEQCAALARKALGEDAFAAAFAEAAGSGLDDVVRYALRERPATRAAGKAAEPGGLTRRQREIAELVARGMSNKEIAAALVLSGRTVEGHVENILVKLGLTSRTQVASWLAGQPGRPA
ncbi:LuxR family transcriptional regulator fused with ATPase domain [Amycolatopsis mediterranei S699]|uniref:LuxR family transcriptional regulator fused with ATPase domain n=3 Tax=Amycolatopsis mediterranei TaxID=33910 RepID=A0A0H3D4I9_AMYMU|nr:LuxR family transcriptional regulator [Amycolatopsis mediterranei]ADJ45112.1 LuxR family transcriptional regulator fused with ATPase domain [Amycolatopsis mediterranei U32]AEK41868.1 LuxR family transcriptional regulator fused with ATPase domain [Amycolatopsis mediterranei S699]AFO76823.1 LuxR family transcriptional regulator fused with ATPase domain [Amycolatopsis mediterranei S699]AGT83951.1 LuxR family transcriptional regulator fused with ATPase domain [Amycolatopsis mediterranei RB]KDO0